MNLHRTTTRIPEDIFFQTQQFALINKITVQEIVTKALKQFHAKESLKKTKHKIKFMSRNLGSMPDPITRDYIYED